MILISNISIYIYIYTHIHTTVPKTALRAGSRREMGGAPGNPALYYSNYSILLCIL